MMMMVNKVWESGRATEYGIDVYTTGDCWVLAYYLARELNSKVAFIGGEEWGHACAPLSRNGTKFLDITGVRGRKEMLDKYTWRGSQEVWYMNISNKTFRDYLNTIIRHTAVGGHLSESYSISHDVARNTAKKLVALHS